MGRRGILPSLGAGTSLIVAGVLCLVVISSIIAFRGFPGLGPEPARPPVRLALPAAQQSGRAAPAAIVLGAGTSPARLVAAARRSDVRVRSTGPTVRIDTPAIDPSPGTSPAPDPVTGGGAAPVAPTPAAAEEEQQDSAPAARPRPVRNTVDRLRGIQPPVDSPPAPPAAQPVVDQVAGAVDAANGVVDQAAGVADGVVGDLLP